MCLQCFCKILTSLDLLILTFMFWFWVVFVAHAEFVILYLVLLMLALDVFRLCVYLCNNFTCFLGEWGSLAPSHCQGNTGRWMLDWSPPWQHGHCPENDGYCYSHSSDLQIQGQGHKYYRYIYTVVLSIFIGINFLGCNENQSLKEFVAVIRKCTSMNNLFQGSTQLILSIYS